MIWLPETMIQEAGSNMGTKAIGPGGGPTPEIGIRPKATEVGGDSFDWRTFDPAMLPGGMDAPLAVELITYRDKLDEMLGEHAESYVIIKGDRVVSYHNSRKNALKAAFESYGRDPVLIKKVVEREPIQRLGGVV